MFNIKFYTKLKIIILNIFFLNSENIFNFILKNHKKSNSQIFQDLFVLYYTKNKKRGFFIEIGGGNGFDLSNTYLLEKKFKWDGIICEPNVKLQKNISELRSAQLIKKPITKRCVKNMDFYENIDPYQSSIIKTNNFKKLRRINSLCLNHLLKNFNKNKIIDYISIDTEGNELEILKNFNFKKFKVNIFTIEHNFKEIKRKEILKIMKKNNYIRVHKKISYMDDWYIKSPFNFN
jgi:hypothetical protein